MAVLRRASAERCDPSRVGDRFGRRSRVRSHPAPHPSRLMRHLARSASLVLLVAAATSPALGSQTVAAGAPLAAVCPSGGRPTVDSAVTTILIGAGRAWNQREFTEAERRNLLFVADAIRSRFVAPSSLGALVPLAETSDAGWGGDRSDHVAVTARLVLVLRRNGRLRDLFWQLSPRSASLAAALAAAARKADIAGELAAPRSGGSAEDDTVVVQIFSRQDSIPAGALPLMRARLPRYVASLAPVRTTESPLYFPMYSRDGMIENDAEMYVTVGSDGKVVASETQVTRLELPLFLSIMQRTVGAATYEPAMSGGCRVPSVVIERFKLRIDR